MEKKNHIPPTPNKGHLTTSNTYKNLQSKTNSGHPPLPLIGKQGKEPQNRASRFADKKIGASGFKIKTQRA